MAPRNLINLESVSHAYGTRQIFDNLSLGIGTGERIGVVGRNGGGKSTLLRLLAGSEQPDSGRVTHTGGLRIGTVGQRDELDPDATVRDCVVGGLDDHEWAGDARVREVLAHLLPEIALDARVGPLSGGERRRVALARTLITDADLLLLDEPTNHLDVEAIDWLTRHLASAGRALVLVTHDRWLLDSVCETTWEVVDTTVHAYDGGYSTYVLARAERARIAAADEARRQNLLRKELAWLRRGPPARTSKPKFRIDAANELIENEPPPRDPYELARMATTRLGKSVYDVENVSVRLGEKTLLDDVTWRLGPGDRVGVVGVNGSGKTSLLRLLDGSLMPSSGHVKVGKTVVAAHLSQEVSELDPQTRVLQAVEEVRKEVRLGAGGAATAGQMLERFGFASQRQWTPVGDLSGGERRRLQLLRLLMGEPNVLLLDEPTNDLDVETLNVLEDVLDSWPGTLVVVSHDRWFLERATDAIWALLGDGRLVHLPGGVDEYLERRRAADADVPAAAGAASSTGASAGTGTGEGTGAAPGAGAGLGRGETRREKRGDTRAARKELARVERDVEKLTQRAEKLHAELAEHATDHQKVAELDAKLRTVTAEREALEERWMELADEVG
ncbi:ABC-F family ATP-binding cassette domain-containing protein [Phytoactinopolyspora halotolerans]|uniref:ABC-F family ATP-binding cassette domain-containing protein n=1 Tax=Phytoactinopolyspora halotolerans TaxID=1981512 RepID=A0A6L9S4S6_9ACTN|nr:ABC-F family ATP-binding cassette domain-containing protein [Phytoactinopolyspora halotolerans]NED99517.1 ABC-F family ATP-binding cassette domain-containing protein [Phytoactinopolyspora halotolerans]